MRQETRNHALVTGMTEPATNGIHRDEFQPTDVTKMTAQFVETDKYQLPITNTTHEQRMNPIRPIKTHT